MIAVLDDGRGMRTYRLTVSLRDLAIELLPGLDEATAVHRLMRRIPADELATIDRLLMVDRERAAARALSWLKMPARAFAH